jgi:hypothetical protein
MVNRFSQQKLKQETGGERLSAEQQREKLDGSSLTRVNTSRQRFKLSAVRSKYAMQTTQEDSSLLKNSQDFEDSTIPAPIPSPSHQTRPSVRLKELVEGKTANYRLMKEREQELDVIRRLKSEECQRLLRERVALAAAKKQ